MLDWYFGQTPETLWLSTSPGTRAERFYRTAGWQEAGTATDAVNVIATAGPIPSDALVLSSALPPDLSNALVTGLAALPHVEAEGVRGLLGADSFERLRPAHFQELQKLVESAKKPGSIR